MLTYVPRGGKSIDSACDVLCKLSDLAEQPAAMMFTGTPVVAYPDQDPDAVMKLWRDLRDFIQSQPEE